jgi:hypothetical protein
MTAYANFHYFPWGWKPRDSDFPLQTVEFTIKNPAGYAGRRAITVTAQKAVPVGSGTNYPYRNLPSPTKHFAGDPFLTALSVSDVPTDSGASPTVNQNRRVTLRFTANIHGSGAYADIDAGTKFTVSGLLTKGTTGDQSTTNPITVALSGTSASLFSSTATLTRCSRTLEFTVATGQSIGFAQKNIELTFDLVTLSSSVVGNTVTVHSGPWNSETPYSGDGIDPPIAVTGEALSTTSSPVTLTPSRVTPLYTLKYYVDRLFGGEQISVVQTTASCSTMGATSSNTKVELKRNPAGGTTVDLSGALVAGSYQTCVLPQDECATATGFGAAITYNTASLTVVSPAVTSTNSLNPSSVSEMTFSGAKDGDIVAITASEDCAGASTNAVDSEQATARRALTNGGKLSLPNTLTRTPLYVCYATKEAFESADRDPGLPNKDRTFAMIQQITIANGGSVVIVAGSTVAPTMLMATLLSALVFLLARN